MKKFNSINFTNKRVIVREDFNVPLDDKGNITNDQRLKAALPTIKALLEQNASVILLSHLGRPKEGQYEEKYSLKPVAEYLSNTLKQPVALIKNYLEAPLEAAKIILCENVRFNVGEKANDKALSQKLSTLGDIFVMDAFATAHRAEASTCGIAQYLPSCAGPLLEAELNALEQAFAKPTPPVLAIVGGSKVSDKLKLLRNLITKVQILIVGGGIANTFLAAQNFPVGQSLYEPNLLDEARAILAEAKKIGCHIPLPQDVVVAKILSPDTVTEIKNIHDVSNDDKIFDIGPKTIEFLSQEILKANTILWNGPVGVFEMASFAKGTEALGQAIAESSAFSIAGGGDTLSAIENFNLHDKISYLSTGGGAFLEYLEGKVLPAVAALEANS